MSMVVGESFAEVWERNPLRLAVRRSLLREGARLV
jgi:hypothetical protein